jgi:hypothetical protein
MPLEVKGENDVNAGIDTIREVLKGAYYGIQTLRHHGLLHSRKLR